MDNPKRIYKDSLFRTYFKDVKNFAELCNAVTGLNFDAAQFRENTVDEILFNSLRNDVSFSVGEACFVFFEHQSTRNFNMPLRMLFYLSMLYRSETEEDFIYQTQIIPLHAPKFFVFYNGKEPCPEESILKLSDAFSMPGDIELTVKVFNINYNKNFRLIRDCRPVHDYSCFIDRVNVFLSKGMSRSDAIIAAMKWCRQREIMSDFWSEHWWEVFEMVNLVWNEEDAKKSYIAQGRKISREEGLLAGRKEGLLAGREEGLLAGREEGRLAERKEWRQNMLNGIRNLMKNFKLSAKSAMDTLGISPEMQKELAPLI